MALSVAASPSTSRLLRSTWQRLRGVPGGRWVFSRLFCRWVPYSGSVKPTVIDLEPGTAVVSIPDRHEVRNHLDSVHAIAIMNLAEMTTGLALVPYLDDNARAIITKLAIEYVKKARGTLTARCTCQLPSGLERVELALHVDVVDPEGQVVARAVATWLVGPRSPKGLA